MERATKLVRGLAPLLLVAAVTGCDSSPTDPLAGMNVLFEGTLVAEEGELENQVVAEPIEHRLMLEEEGLVRLELVLWRGTDGETGEEADFSVFTPIGFNIGRVLPDGSCERGFNASLFRANPVVFRLSRVEYCFEVFAPTSGGTVGFLDVGDTATYQISLVDTE